MTFLVGQRQAFAARRTTAACVLVAMLAGASSQTFAQDVMIQVAQSPAGEPIANKQTPGQAPGVDRTPVSPTAQNGGTTSPTSGGQIAIGEVPAGLPTVDQPAGAGQAPRKLSPGKGQTSWDTYLYEGPGYHYSVIDEVDQGHPLQIINCSNEWCKVVFDGGRRGYIIAEVLTTGDPAKAEPGFLPNPATAIIPNPPGPCFDALQTEGNGGTQPTRYCEKASQ